MAKAQQNSAPKKFTMNARHSAVRGKSGTQRVSAQELAKNSETIHSGWLSKLGHIIKSWRTRFFLLSKHTLAYYKNPSDMKTAGSIDIENAVVMEEPKEAASAFSIHPAGSSRTYTLVAGSPFEMQKWVKLLNQQAKVRRRGRRSVLLNQIRYQRKHVSSASQHTLNHPSVITYLPKIVLRRLLLRYSVLKRKSMIALANAQTPPQFRLLPTNAESKLYKNACVVIADISGFTKLNEVAAKGDGAEHVCFFSLLSSLSSISPLLSLFSLSLSLSPLSLCVLFLQYTSCYCVD